MNIAFLGVWRAPFLTQALQACLAHGVPVAAVVVDSKEPSDYNLALWAERTRGALPWIPPDRLDDGRIPFHFVGSHISDVTVNLLRDLRIDLAVNAGTPRKLDRRVIGATRHGVLNVHPGILPKYRGACCVEWSILRGDPVGNTAHLMDENIDTGPVLTTRRTIVSPGEDYAAIRTRVYRDGFLLMAETLAALVAGRLVPTDAKPQGAGEFHRPPSEEGFAAMHAKLAAGAYRSDPP